MSNSKAIEMLSEREKTELRLLAIRQVNKEACQAAQNDVSTAIKVGLR